MPALQVRDFPMELYGELKAYASQHHRSLAQQTIIAVDEMLRRYRGCEGDGTDLRARGRNGGAISQGSEAFDGGVAPRRATGSLWSDQAKCRRQQLFSSLDALSWEGESPSTEAIVELVNAGRRERDERVFQASSDPFGDAFEDKGALL